MEMVEVITPVKNGDDHYFANFIKHFEQKVFTDVI